MKVAICSDLHLEFGPISLKNPGDVDILILSGDICVDADLEIYDRRQIEMETMTRKSLAYHKFFEEVSSEFKDVIYIAGNHEHYHGDYAHTMKNLKKKLAHYENIHVLDKEVFKLGDYLFVGGTLWTDMNNEDPLTLQHMTGAMNDFRLVMNSNRKVTFKVPVTADKPVGMTDEEFNLLPEGARTVMKFKERDAKFSPQDAVEDHRMFLQYLQFILQESAPWETVIVVGHHAPCKMSTHPRYKHEHLMNGGYSSDLSEFILDHPQIKLWTHGHTHEPFDYMLGSTRIVCNPRGYIGYENSADNFELKVVEI
jgi:Icc-related predicted phosphoesterase